MKEQKWAIWISIVVFVITFGVAALLEKNEVNREFATNLQHAIFNVFVLLCCSALNLLK
ncbi:hypothetical protein ACTQ34_02900 [Agathobaculum sp. LCP25S3_E8]|uniref:hypothetical protein n=1 Tax=Agathobaculum sp. LCP25S3_E8 TaxID=3438735 RepID=UPI003F8F0432